MIHAVSYTIWDARAKAGNLKVYLRGNTAWVGTPDLIYRCDMTAAQRELFDTDHLSGASLVASEGDARAEIVGEKLRHAQPAQPDGRRVVVMSPSTEGWMTWVTSRGDDLAPTPPASGRGEGAQLRLSFVGPATKTVDLLFSEPVELHDGELSWDPASWGYDDEFTFSAVVPATVPGVNATGTGNANLAPQTGFSVIVPAAGDGSHDVALSAPLPVVPAAPADTGYWDVDRDTGIVSPGSPGKAGWNLLDVQVESFFLKRIGMGHNLGVFDLDTYKAEWVSPAWRMRLSVTRATTGAGVFDVGGWLMFFRESST